MPTQVGKISLVCSCQLARPTLHSRLTFFSVIKIFQQRRYAVSHSLTFARIRPYLWTIHTIRRRARAWPIQNHHNRPTQWLMNASHFSRRGSWQLLAAFSWSCQGGVSLYRYLYGAQSISASLTQRNRATLCIS